MKELTAAQIDQINDFVCNGYEHCGEEEGLEFLMNEVGIDEDTARRAMSHYLRLALTPGLQLTAADLMTKATS